jgi:predicted amidohydrolase
MVNIRVAGIQMEVAHDLRDNYPRILAHIRLAAEQGAQYCLFPEASLSGYHGEFLQEEVDQALAGIAQACKDSRITALISTGMHSSDGIQIQIRIYTQEGELLGYHAKMVPTSGDRKWCVPGNELRIFRHDGIVFGCLICNDLWVTPGCGPYPDPRLTYQLGQRGAQVVFHAINSGFSAQHLPYHESNLALRANESGFPIITANAVIGRNPANCTSGVMGTQGEWLVKANPIGEQRFLAEVDVKSMPESAAGLAPNESF